VENHNTGKNNVPSRYAARNSSAIWSEPRQVVVTNFGTIITPDNDESFRRNDKLVMAGENSFKIKPRSTLVVLGKPSR